EWWKELFLNQKSKVLTDEERQFFQKYFGGSAGSPLTKKAEGFASKIAKLASFQGLSASKIASFLLDSVKAKNFILGLIKLSSLNGEQLLDKLENIKGLSSIISKFRLSQIDLNKTEIDEADKAILGDPFVTIKLDREAGDLGISLTQSPNTIVSKREKSIIEEHYAITRERMAERDKKHSPVHDPEEDLNYRGKVSEYYNRVFLTSVAKQMEDFVDIHFTNKGRKLGFIVKVGIGANEEYDHHTRAVYETKKNGIVYAVMNNSYEFEEFRKRHPDANGDNTLMIYESRSGETEEPLKVFLFNYKDFPVSIVFSNQGPLHDTAEGWIKKQQQKEEVPTILRLDFRTDMAGRYMRRKTPMSYCALHLLDEISRRPEVRITNSGEVKRIRQLVAEMKGVKDSSYAAGVIEAQIQTQEARLKHTYADRWAYKYMLVTDEADRLLSFTKKEESLAVQIAEFIHRNQMLSRLTPGGRDQIALIVNDEDILWPATEQPIQNWMEGVNKPGNKMIMAPYLFSEEPHAIQGILDQAGSHIALFVFNKKHPSYQEAKKKAQEMYAKGIPLVMIEINEPNIENTAGFSSLMEDFIVYYAGIIGQNPYTNPEVKYVRENSDTRLVVIGDEKRERLGQPAIPAVTKEEKAIKIKEVNPKDDALVSFVSMFDQIAEALSIDSKEAISAFEDNLDGELVINALAEANGVHRQTAVDGVNKTGEFHKIVKDYEEVMRKKEEMQKSKVDKSVFMDETKARQKAKQLGIEGIEFSLGPSDIAVDKEALEYLKKLYEEIRGDDSLAKRIAEFIHLSVSLLEQEGKRRDNIVLTTNDQYRLDFAKAFKEHWAYNISKLAKFIFGIDKLPRASHMVIEGRLGQADSHFNIIVLAEDLGLSKRQVLSNEDVEFSNPAHQGLDRNKALFGLALGNKDTILAKMPGIAIKVKEITPEMNLKLINLGREISKHYAEILRKISSSPFAAPVIESEGTFDVTYEDGIFLLTSEEKSMFQTMQAEQMIMQAI
ncbi:MAG: hypothetical protein KKE11_01010, partial [Gammaproteobacteria bacterium]|nr:hypothetical protein [Gammaproteobacteria bacterium]